MRQLVRDLCPPLVWRLLSSARRRIVSSNVGAVGGRQDLDVYWDARMAEMLETWGEGNAWNEIQLLMAQRDGRVLDIACGTGRTIALLGEQLNLEVHGCDISDMLIGKAIARGIPKERLIVCDATAMTYSDGAFEFGYSIGSLEHFTEEGIVAFLRECRRVVRGPTFHMIPVSRSQTDEGWIKTFQSYFNNSTPWWLAKARAAYVDAYALPSVWQDERSNGIWLVCLPPGVSDKKQPVADA
jgi:ubiquinone/menaquinone biosynthesis C-methylase UbiE